MFSWKPIYKEIAEKLLSYEDRQSELVEIIKKLREEGFASMELYDKDEEGEIPLEGFDPFTFFANFNRGTTLENIEKILARLKELWNLKSPVPTDFKGLPEVDKRNAWFFNWKKDRDPKDIPLLWKLFKEAMNDSVQAETFNNALKIGRIGNSKLTAGLSWVQPDKHLNINPSTAEYLKAQGIKPEFDNYQSYKNILDQAKKRTGKEFFEINHEAWEEYGKNKSRQSKEASQTGNPNSQEQEMKKSDSEKQSIENLPLNLILYGPPGTGKTFELQSKYFPLFTSEAKKRTKEDYIAEVAEDLTWFNAIIIAMLLIEKEEGRDKIKVAEIYNSKVVQAKKNISASKDALATVWVALQTYTKPDCEKVKYARRREPAVFWKNDDKTWEVDKEIVKEELPEIYEHFEKIKDFKPSEEKGEEKRYDFVTFHQSFSYEDFVEGIKPNLGEEDAEGKISYEIASGIFKKMALRAAANKEKKFAIFIDEINRGNVASVFGELITLIEKDKRDKLSVRLPYSKDNFTVPSNLYIIATMNTADRNIEALDVALRRRFSFKELAPNPEVLGHDEHRVEKIDLQKMLEAINKRIGFLLDKDHLIGHSYFMGISNKNDPLDELKKIFANNIIPLLEEYFYGDRAKIKMVLGKPFVEEEEQKSEELFKEIEDKENQITYEKIYTYEVTVPKTIEGFISIYE